MTWLEAHITGLAWTFAAWALLIAVSGGALYRRWWRRERHDAAETAEILETLGYDRTHAHDYDGFQ